MNDPLGDMLTRIRNAQLRGKSTTVTPASKLRRWVLEVLADEGYIRGFEDTTDVRRYDHHLCHAYGAARSSPFEEAVVAVIRYAFDELDLHRVQISIVPRNTASRRVVEKIGVRAEGVAERYLEINGTWEDHIRFAMTSEEWEERSEQLTREWL